MSGRRQGDGRRDYEYLRVREAKLHELTRDEMEALLREREHELSQSHLRWLEQWVPHEEDWPQ